MRRASVSILHLLLAAVVCLSPLLVGGQEPSTSVPSNGATALAKKYLGTIEKALSFPSTEDGGQDAIFIGQSLESTTWMENGCGVRSGKASDFYGIRLPYTTHI